MGIRTSVYIDVEKCNGTLIEPNGVSEKGTQQS